MELADLKVNGDEVLVDERIQRVIREDLPNQRLHHAEEEAALRFGLPMSGMEIHERVRRTLRPRWALSIHAKVGTGVCALVAAIFLGWLMPWGWAAWGACKGEKCGDAGLGFGIAAVVGFLAFVIGSVIVGGNIQSLERTSAWTWIGHYTPPIPDQALLKYAEAKTSGLFKTFYVVEPAYERRSRTRSVDPWLVGALAEGNGDARSDPRRSFIVLAYWD